MHRLRLILVVVLASTASVAAVASAQGQRSDARSSRAAAVDLSHTGLGSMLTSASGDTLYEFTRDHGAQNSCVKLSGCSSIWPALESSGRPTAGPGVRASLLSTVQLPGGARQVTYAGHPLYLYSGDRGPRATGYVGAHSFGGTWDAINASGQTVR